MELSGVCSQSQSALSAKDARGSEESPGFHRCRGAATSWSGGRMFSLEGSLKVGGKRARWEAKTAASVRDELAANR